MPAHPFSNFPQDTIAAPIRKAAHRKFSAKDFRLMQFIRLYRYGIDQSFMLREMGNKRNLWPSSIEPRKYEMKSAKKESLPKPAVETAGYCHLPL